MFSLLDDDLLLYILSYTDSNTSLLTALTCKRFYQNILTIYDKPLQFNYYNENDFPIDGLNLLIYSHKYQVKKKNIKKMRMIL